MSEKRNIGILLIDDHRRVHQAIAEMISYIDDIDLLGQGNNGLEAIDLCNRYQPDLVLMDIVMPVMDGIEATKRIINEHPNIKILALSSFKDQATIREMLESGAVGYVLKEASVSDLENTIRTACEGNAILSPEVMQMLLQAPPSDVDVTIKLTQRETEVLKHFAEGKTNAEIGSELTISVSTVKFHINNILGKLDVQTRAEALVIAAKNNLI